MTCPPHRWRLETPNGPTIVGECKYCSEQRLFKTSFEEDFGGDPERIAASRQKAVDNAEKAALRHCPPGHIGIRKAAAEFDVSYHSLEHAVSAGKIPFVRAGNRRWIKVDDVQKWDDARPEKQRPAGRIGLREAGEQVDASRQELEWAIESGKISVVKAGNRRWLLPEEVQQWYKKRTSK